MTDQRGAPTSVPASSTSRPVTTRLIGGAVVLTSTEALPSRGDPLGERSSYSRERVDRLRDRRALLTSFDRYRKKVDSLNSTGELLNLYNAEG